MIRILDVGGNKMGNPAKVYEAIPDKEIVLLDIDPDHNPDVLHDITEPLPKQLIGKFDIVYCSHVFEHIDRIKVSATVKYVSAAVKRGGDMVVIVPSLEWCAKMILSGQDTVAVYGSLYGGQQNQWEYHRCGFTMALLSDLLRSAGLKVVDK